MALINDYTGKIIKIRILNKPAPGEESHAYRETYSEILGMCTFSGYNQWLGVDQITINRMPIWPVKDSDITILNVNGIK